MKILYLSWGERVSDSGLYRSQILNLCAALAAKGTEVHLCSFVPIFNRDLINLKHKYVESIKKNILFAKERGVRLIVKHYLGSSYESYTAWFLWPLIYAPWNIFRLKRIIAQGNFDVIHCRSYHSTNAAIKVLRLLRISIPVVFDPRGLMPEEGVLHQRYSLGSLSYRRWKDLEQSMCQSVPITVAVSMPMKRHFEKLGANNVPLVYISSDMVGSAHQIPLQVKTHSSKQLIYIGAVGSWHPVESIFDVFKSFQKTNPKATLRILTAENSWPKIHQAALNKSVDVDSYSLGYISSRKSLQEELANSFAGLLTYRTPLNPVEDVIAQTVLSTKFVEYLTSGIPVIVNKYCGGATEYINSHECGVVYDPDDINQINFEPLDNFWSNLEKRRSIVQGAVENFSVERNAQRYLSIYTKLVTRPSS